MSRSSGRRLRVALLTQPSRLPTAVHDPGGWWPELALRGHELLRLDVNGAWWRTLCTREGYRLVTGEDAFHGWMLSAGERSALEAGASLRALQQSPTFRTEESYLAAAAPLARYLDLVNERAADVSVQWVAGPISRTADYADSRSLLEHAARPGVFRRLIQAALPSELPMIDLLIVSVTAPEDLLTAMTVVDLLRERQPEVHACLADHGFENFSLRPHLETLRESGALTQVFDTVIVARDERDAAAIALAEALIAGERPSGWLRLSDLPAERSGLAVPLTLTPVGPGPQHVPPHSETFAPEPVLLTRVSQRRCYWSRCTFCIHNAKYDDPSPPSLAEVDTAVLRLETFFEAGYRTFIFLDEALSPALLTRLSRRLERTDLPARGMRWACRSKIESAHTAELFDAMRRAGCCEVLFGIESTSPRVLRLMDKYSDGLTPARMLEILRAAADAGLGLHLNMIAGFPGDGRTELDESLAFVEEAGALPNVTFTVNPFVVFPATPVHDQPEQFNVALEPVRGDMQAICGYEVIGPDGEAWRSSMEHLPSLLRRLRSALGWDRYDDLEGGRMALDLYFGTGHGTYFKAMTDNPLAGGRQPSERTGVK